MTRTNPPDVEALLAQLAANAAEIAALKARVSTLEEELRLAQQHRFGPSSEKHMDRLFNEAIEGERTYAAYFARFMRSLSSHADSLTDYKVRADFLRVASLRKHSVT